MTIQHVFDRYDINGSMQHVLVRGPEAAPVLLLVQAGPGLPMIHEADALQAQLQLEQRWRVAYWDQRGTGLSLEASTAALDCETLSRDLSALSEALCARFGVEHIDVVGFSFGGSVALLAAANGRARIRRVIAVGPDVDLPASEEFAWRFARDEALRRGHRRALRELALIGPPPHDSPQRFITRVKWVSNFGGVAVGMTFVGMFATLVARLIRSPYYTLPQALRALMALRTAQNRMLGALQGFSLPGLLRSVPVPVTIVQGRLDAAAPPKLAQEFVDGLDAPSGKRLVMLEDCAHTPHYEAPALFRAVVLEALA
jgi:pimeloyl-ACP methyl ester carboxylesterase